MSQAVEQIQIEQYAPPEDAAQAAACEFTLRASQYMYLPFKRLFDIVFSIIALVILSPLFLIVAIIVKLDSPGPAFYVKRNLYGKNGRRIFTVKFRSMYDHADEMRGSIPKLNEKNGPLYIKPKDDPRVTKVGKFIRTYSIDELPQLVCVLFGYLSIVGPRPLLIEEVEESMDDIQEIRSLIKPGLTCIWQVSGRSNIPEFDKRMKMDLEYVDKMSFLEDIVLILKTIPVVISGDGAC